MGNAGDFLAIRGLVMAFGGVRAVDGIDLDLERGAMVAVIGPNGCGKTTLFNLITGMLKPTAGSILFEGRPIGGRAPVRIAREGIVRKFQVPSVFPELTVAQNVAVAASVHAAGTASASGTLGLVGLAGAAARHAGSLSHGEKQWLELALVLAARPRLVLLDEPAGGMSRAEKARTVEMIARVRRETGVAFIVIEHDMVFVQALDCPVKAMMAGRVVAQGSLDTVRRDPRVREGYLGRQAVAHG